MARQHSLHRTLHNMQCCHRRIIIPSMPVLFRSLQRLSAADIHAANLSAAGLLGSITTKAVLTTAGISSKGRSAGHQPARIRLRLLSAWLYQLLRLSRKQRFCLAFLPSRLKRHEVRFLSKHRLLEAKVKK